MKVISFPILCIAVLLSSVSMAQNADTLCGPRSLQTICRMYKIDATIDELCDLTGYDKINGTSILGLMTAAKTLGLPAVALKMDTDDLCMFKRCGIVYINDSHFCVFTQCAEDSIRLISNDKNLVYSREQFNARWKGEAIIFSDSLLIALKQNNYNDAGSVASSLEFKESEKDFGVVKEGEVLSHTFTFTNVSDETVTIDVRSTCGCTAAIVTDKALSPGESGSIFVEFNTQGRLKGLNRQRILVRTDNANDKILGLTVSATVKGTVVVSPHKIWLDTIPAGTNKTRRFEVVDSGTETLKVLDVITPDGITTKILSPRTNRDDKLIVPVDLTLSATDEYGEFERNIVVVVDDGEVRNIPVTVYGKIVHDIEAFPTQIVFGNIKAGECADKTITIINYTGENIDIGDFSSDCTNLSYAVNNAGKRTSLTVTLNAPESASMIQDTITLCHGKTKRALLEIPFSANIVTE